MSTRCRVSFVARLSYHKEEVARIRDNFLKKKLAPSSSDGELDEAIAAVGEKMKNSRSNNRVTVLLSSCRTIRQAVDVQLSLPRRNRAAGRYGEP